MEGARPCAPCPQPGPQRRGPSKWPCHPKLAERRMVDLEGLIRCAQGCAPKPAALPLSLLCCRFARWGRLERPSFAKAMEGILRSGSMSACTNFVIFEVGRAIRSPRGEGWRSAWFFNTKQCGKSIFVIGYIREIKFRWMPFLWRLIGQCGKHPSL